MKKTLLKLIHRFIPIIVCTLFHACLSKTDVLFTAERIVTVSTISDLNGYSSIEASVGEIISGIISDPSTWVITNISENIGISSVGDPVACSSTAGDIVVAWTYLNNNFIGNIAAAILPHDSTTWSVSSITNNVNFESYINPALGCDLNGNVVLAWSSNDNATGRMLVNGSIKILNTNNNWSNPFVIIPE